MSRNRELSYNHVPPLSASSSSSLPGGGGGGGGGANSTTRELLQQRKATNFKSYYFQIQNLINSNVSLSLKFEQLKTPEILSTLIKPIIVEIISITDKSQSHLPPTQFSDPKSKLKISTFTIYILLLLRYEYLIQSENNLICFDLLCTKANVCELLAIRMLREYRSWQRIQMLFIKPPAGLATATSNTMSTMGMMDVNTLELGILSKSKRFLSQPIVIHILKRFYNGDLVYGGSCSYYHSGEFRDDEKSALLGARRSSRKQPSSRYNIFTGDGNKSVTDCGDYDLDGDGDSSADEMIFDDSIDKFSIVRIFNRAQLVPKYQHVLINLKLINFAIVYFIMILQPNEHPVFVELYFWLLALSFNCEVFTKLTKIDHRFLNLVIWNQIDLLFISIIDLCFFFKFIWQSPRYYHDVFSLIGIILFPRILSVFNNYRFFSLILLSFHKMIFNLIGLVLFFFTLISGFYFSFITLSYNQTRQDVLFNMLKIFFGFTPSVWNYWDDFNTLGKIMQMSYLFLIQFIVGTILAICLSGVFTKTRENIEHEFNYFKSNNLILYFKMGQLNQESGVVNWYCQLFKMPLVGVVLAYEAIKHVFSKRRKKMANDDVDLKHFAFINNDQDQFGDQVSIGYVDTSQEAVAIKVNKRQAMKNHQSISTLGGHFRTASTDSFFIDQLLNRKYGVPGNTTLDNKLDRLQTQTQTQAQTQAQVPSVNRVFSRKAQSQRRNSPPMQQQLQLQQQVPIKVQKSFNVPRRGSVFSQPPPPLQMKQQSHSYAPQPFFGSSPPPTATAATTTTTTTTMPLSQSMYTQDILTRISNLESLLAKRMVSTSVDDSKSVMMYRINEIDDYPDENGNRRGDAPVQRRVLASGRVRARVYDDDDDDDNDDELLINSESDDGDEKRGCDCDNDNDNEDVDDEEVSNQTLPLKFNTLSDTEIDQYDSDETF
ncbi:unnamed protein product [Candida parapsilosis]